MFPGIKNNLVVANQVFFFWIYVLSEQPFDYFFNSTSVCNTFYFRHNGPDELPHVLPAALDPEFGRRFNELKYRLGIDED